MIDKTPLPGLDLQSTEAKIQMNNFWKYLDDLAEKNPEEYKKFIQTQMKKGIETFHPSHNQSITTKQEFTVSPYLCLRMKPIKIIKEENTEEKKDDILVHENAGKEIKEVPQIKFGPEFDGDAFSGKVLQNRKIYLNIVMARDYYTPADDQGNFLKGEQFQNENNWRYIPTEFRYNGKNESMSGTRCDYYDVIINQDIIDKIRKDQALYKTISGYIVRKFVIFLNDKIVLYTNSVKIIEKTYKSVTPRPDIFKSKLGERSLAAEKAQQRHLQEMQQKQQKQQPPMNNNIIIPGASEEPLIEESNKKQEVEKKEEKKVVIEEVGAINKQIIPIKKKILNDHQMEVKFMFDEFEYLKGISEIDLQISENGIIIHLDNEHYIIDKNYEPVEMKFNFKVDPDKCTAKFNKKEKILTVIIERIN